MQKHSVITSIVKKRDFNIFPVYTGIFALLFLWQTNVEAIYQHLILTSPEPWIPVTTNLCTLSVKASSPIKSVSFKVKYIPGDNINVIPYLQSLGTIIHPPFQLIWDISDIPNQLTYGITCFINAELVNGKTIKMQQQGLFLTHIPPDPPIYEISYAPEGFFNNNRQSIIIKSPILAFSAKANISWNKKSLLFHVEVQDPFFHNKLPKKKINKLGIDIYLDPQNKKTPYLSKDILRFVIPVTNKPYQIIAQSTYNPDGSFDIIKTKNRCKYYSSVITENYKGYVINFSVPKKILGSTIPESLGCNIIASVLDEKFSVKKLSWIQGSKFAISSPYAYGNLHLLEKPILANSYIQLIIFFVVGLLLGVIIVFIYKKIKKLNTTRRIKESEHEKQLIQDINAIIDSEITNKNLSVNNVASQLSLSPKKVNKIIKKHYGRSFNKHILYSRIEIVKERLRSSNSTKLSIVKSCGFSSVEEMEKIFHSFHGTTLAEYREEHKVT